MDIFVSLAALGSPSAMMSVMIIWGSQKCVCVCVCVCKPCKPTGWWLCRQMLRLSKLQTPSAMRSFIIRHCPVLSILLQSWIKIKNKNLSLCHLMQYMCGIACTFILIVMVQNCGIYFLVMITVWK
jgi:hypothetical protein